MLHEFPILWPDYKTHQGKDVRMLLTWEDQGEHFFSCVRELKPDERQWLIDNWATYLCQRAEWLAWARANLKPSYCPKGATPEFRQSCLKASDLLWILDYQTS